MNLKFKKIKDFILERRKIFIPLFIIIIIGIIFLCIKKKNSDIILISPSYGDFKETVKGTGQVISNTDFNLSFKKQGIVKDINFEVGDKVKEGQIIAKLSSGSEYGELLKAQAQVLQAEARLQKTKEGFTNEEINLVEINLSNAKLDYEKNKNIQDTLVNNAYRTLLNSNIEIIPEDSLYDYQLPTVSGIYNLDKEGQIVLKIYDAVGGKAFSLSGLVYGYGLAKELNPEPIGNSGLYITFPSLQNISGTDWIINIPNKKGNTYLINENAYNQAVKNKELVLSSLESLIRQREAELAIKKAEVRAPDLELGQGEVLFAKGILAQAKSNYEDTIIRAPKDGTITKINIKKGEIANLNQTSVAIEDIDNLYVEALINETDIKNIKLGQKVLINLDSLKEEDFYGEILHIEPSSSSENGVVNYKIKITLNEKNQNIRPGMNAEILITTFEKQNVLSLSKANLTFREGKYFVNKIINKNNNQYKETEIKIGDNGDGNMVEILSGIEEDDVIALIKEN